MNYQGISVILSIEAYSSMLNQLYTKSNSNLKNQNKSLCDAVHI